MKKAWKSAEKMQSTLKGLVVFTASCLVSLIPNAYGENQLELQLGGHLKYGSLFLDSGHDSFSAAIEARKQWQQYFEARANSEFVLDSFALEIDAEISALAQDEQRRRDASLQNVPVGVQLSSDRERRQLFNLSTTLAEGGDYSTLARIDRAMLSYANGSFVGRIGRQAISWGNGILFQVHDPFNPFPPLAIDRDYKSGEDMLYTQVLAENGSDLQVLLIPRRDELHQHVRWQESSFAIRWYSAESLARLQYDLLAAVHYEDQYYGLGLSRELIGALLRADLLVVDEQGSDDLTLAGLFNIDRSWDWMGHSLYTFVEYFHSDFGSSTGEYALISDSLLKRLERGEFFTLGRDYLAYGGSVEASALVSIFANLISNLHDESGLVQVGSTISLLQDARLQIGGIFPFGSIGSEFGGFPAGDGQSLVKSPASGYLRVSVFF